MAIAMRRQAQEDMEAYRAWIRSGEVAEVNETIAAQRRAERRRARDRRRKR